MKPCCHNLDTVVQTKIGACVQLLWSESGQLSETYCSIDIVPTFNVAPIDPLRLAEIVNTAMLEDPRPVNWLRYKEQEEKALWIGIKDYM